MMLKSFKLNLKNLMLVVIFYNFLLKNNNYVIILFVWVLNKKKDQDFIYKGLNKLFFY